MPLESCMILLDNSEFMRNGDYIPTRLEAQSDAANMIVNQKTQSNPESTVGVIAMSSSGPSSGAELLVSPTDDLGKILTALHGVPLCGEMVRNGKDAVDIAASVQVATLALKHRRNKNGAQRIVLFIGSPLTCAEARSFVKAGKQLKKNNVFIDVIAMGELGENEPKLRELVDAANGSSANEEGAERNCHLVTIPAGILPSDVLITSPIFRGDAAPMGGDMGGAAAGGGGGDAFAEYGGVDPNMDPELAMALRVSMEEERARQERVSAAAEESNQEEKSGDDAAAANNAESMEGITDGVENDEDALLQQALAMSMAENQASSSTEETAAAAGGESTAMDMGDDDDDAAMQMALAMSMQGESEEKTDGLDPAFVNQLLGSLPGVNPDDPAIQEALRKAKDESDKKGDEKDDKDE
mmetsp:Transcript_23852/g.34075  ORF Transcript_23852/g.34075 Transcript_23852/m.34075 type:complete len:413 (-) Transcript_23852:1424-2662(-)|eukprot:CAMPEP_0201687432 /NCGR_PEP_ID=MMETSP0578-20130828/1497_1 /ASSEMBLY_ACC=CAM_ASM_000663 /TAXON_ID=267565 /ORGANISM="Skeletonema grethea, Strain CCMP 1804" /LENGTH=412 /DNA_ID=CAMNT_0048171589 /DNA_START=94 /DNA_END=1332 /DNA_ORIENTATION=-